MTLDEMVESTYEAAVGLNRVKAKVGAVDVKTAAATERRVLEAQIAMARIDEIMGHAEPERSTLLAEFKREIGTLNENTVCEKSELNWPARLNSGHFFNNIALWFRVNIEVLFPRLRRIDRRFSEGE
jgi:DNA polymerase/3'-5' exonuclease PolX